MTIWERLGNIYLAGMAGGFCAFWTGVILTVITHGHTLHIVGIAAMVWMMVTTIAAAFAATIYFIRQALANP